MAYAIIKTVTIPTGGTTQTVTGLPSTPIAGIVLSTAGVGVATRPSFSMGYFSGVSAQCCSGQRITRGGGTTDELTINRNDGVGVVYQGFNARTIAIGSITSDGCTVTCSSTLDNAITVSILFFGGAGVSADVYAAPGAAAGTYSRAGLAFTPTMLFNMASSCGGGVVYNSTSSGGHFSTAVWDGTTKRAHYGANRNALSTSEAKSAARTGNGFAANTDATTLTSDPQLTLVSLNAAGYTWTQASAGTQLNMFLALRGVSCKVLTTTVPSSTGNVTLPSAGFNVQAMMTIISPTDSGDDGTLAADMAYGVGFADGTLYESHAYVTPDALAGGSDGDTKRNNAGIAYAYKRTGANTFATRCLATVNAWNIPAPVLNWSVADAVAGQVTVIAFNGGAATGAAFRPYYLAT